MKSHLFQWSSQNSDLMYVINLFEVLVLVDVDLVDV